MALSKITGKISGFFKTDRGKATLKWIQRIINVTVLVWLIYEVSNIGWLKVWQSLPVQPSFYLLFLLIFFQLPLFEIWIYRITWTFDTLKSAPVFLLKRVYNKDVLGYSGELYFFVWAKKTLQIDATEIFKIIKDNNIISSVSSTFISFGLLSIFIFTDQIKVLDWISNQHQTYFWGGLILIVVIVALFLKFRHHVISMPLRTAYKIFGIQTFRQLLGQTFNLLMYYVVMPEVPFYIWFTFIAMEIILSRIPFLPNRDLIFAGMSITLSGNIAIEKDAIAGIVIAKSVLNKIGSLGVFALANLFKQTDMVPEPDDDVGSLQKFEAQQKKSEQSSSS